MTASTCAMCGRKLTLFNRAGNTGLCIRDYRKQTVFYRYFDVFHPTCEAATERHVHDIFGRLIPMLLAFLAVSWIGTAVFGTTIGWFFMAAGLFLAYRAGYPAKGHPVDQLRFQRFFYVFAGVMVAGSVLLALISPPAMQNLPSIVYTRLYPQYMMLIPAVVIALVVVYLFVERDELTSDTAYTEWKTIHPERMT